MIGGFTYWLRSSAFDGSIVSPPLMERIMEIAPRLWGGRVRENLYGRLPHAIKEGLRAIARRERKSMSWVVEEVIIDYFSLDRPKYVEQKKRKKKNG